MFVPVTLVGAALLVVAGAVQAALPPKGASFRFHDHDTAGKNWHIELRIDSQDPKKLKTLVAYSQQCKGTIAKTGVPISDAGVIAANGGLPGYGSWEVNATFIEPTRLVGTMRMRRVDCDTGPLGFPTAITGDGHTDHEHGGGHDHARKFPDFASSKFKQRKQARALHRRVLKNWSGMTLAKAEGLGFFEDPARKGKLGMIHVYNRRYERDERIFDAKRPESLVFWRGSEGEPVILGPMFRVPPGKRPAFAGPIPIYHSHGSGKFSQMTHVWMVKGPKSAWVNCLPVWHLEQYNPAFDWMPGQPTLKHVGEPC